MSALVAVHPRRSPCAAVAREAHELGLCVLPPREDGSKRPIGLWTERQKTSSTREEVEEWYGSRTGIGLVTGAVSGNVELFEFDDRVAYEAFKAAAPPEIATLVERLEEGFLEKTPGGGFHWFYRCEVVSGNLKLASRPKRPEEMLHPKDKWKTLIETRGEGGYVVIAPSHGRVHASGRSYELVRGSLKTIRTISPAEREALHAYARSFDLMPKKPAFEPPKKRGRLSEDFDLLASWDSILTPHGWRPLHEKDGVTYWQRPGKGVGDVPPGTSATTNHAHLDRLYVFSSSTEFEQGRSYSKFAAHVTLNYNGDWKAAASAARAHVERTAPPSTTATIEERLVTVVVKRPRVAGCAALGEHYRATRELMPESHKAWSFKTKGMEWVHAPGVAALLNALDCSQYHLAPECKQHGVDGVKTLMCHRDAVACEVCSIWRATQIEREILEDWKAHERVILWRNDLPDSTLPQDQIAALDRLARVMNKCVPKRHKYHRRTIKGLDYVIMVLEVGHVGEGREFSRGVLSAQHHAEKLGLSPVFRTVPLKEAVEAIRVAWRSPNVRFLEVLESGDYQSAATFPWLVARVHRTSSTRPEDTTFPWPGKAKLSAKAKAAMLEKRHGIPEFYCAEQTGIVQGAPVFCMAPQKVPLVSNRSGRVLGTRFGKGYCFHEARQASEFDHLADVVITTGSRNAQE